MDTVSDESPWYDRTNIGETDDEENESQESCDDIEYLEAKTVKNFENISAGHEILAQPGRQYPLDLWCILANYITPEQVQVFSCICRGSYFALSSFSFWLRLYKRFISDSECLPARLKSDWIESRNGFKSRVVRALFIGYKSLHDRLGKKTLETTRDTHATSQLIGLRCSHAWYKLTTSPKNTDMFLFYFKFKCNDVYKSKFLSTDDERVQYLTANNERDFIVLQITVSNFILLKPVLGENLTDISVNLSRNLRFHCIKMTFHDFRHDGRYRKGDGKVIVLDPVSEFRLLRWWYPLYPHCDD
ncbi:transmembrane protein 183-like [Dendronephthya gigantea]|uniref:transmembrane protein 183-like n=1 Tax=Dendronephthya gigantea TaxID=151771 RepID=UPI00106C4A45|nr:transmembrane protein 183-like [Dendronephthya gigantea]